MCCRYLCLIVNAGIIGSVTKLIIVYMCIEIHTTPENPVLTGQDEL